MPCSVSMRGGAVAVAKMTSIIPTHERQSCFHAAKTSAKIDFIRLANGRGHKLPRSITGIVKHHAGGFTVHDPSPDDVLLLRGLELVECEFAIDFKPPKNVRGADRSRQCQAIHQYITSRIWPFDSQGVQRSYRVSPAPEIAYKPYSVDEHGAATDPRLPDLNRLEVEYLGHRSGFIGRDHSMPSWAQVRIYHKTTDQSQCLPDEQKVVRMEVTIDEDGLRRMNLHDAADLAGFRFRPQLAVIFRMLKPEAASDLRAKPRGLRTSTVCPNFVKRLRQGMHSERIKLVHELGAEGGLVSLLNTPGIMINTTLRDEPANRKIGTALDNLSKRYAKRYVCTS